MLSVQNLSGYVHPQYDFGLNAERFREEFQRFLDDVNAGHILLCKATVSTSATKEEYTISTFTVDFVDKREKAKQAETDGTEENAV